MRGLVPASLLSAATQPDARIIAINHLDARAGSLPEGTVLLRRNGLERIVSALDLHPASPAKPSEAPARLATGLRLPRENVMCREVQLPLAAARTIETVIGFEMDRLTPFAVDELFWGIGGLKQDRANDRLSVQLFFVLRREVDHLLQALRRIGISPAFIEVPGPEGGQIDLATEHRPSNQRQQALLAGLCAGLALACLASPFLRQQLAMDSTAQTIAAIAPAAQTAENLRRQLEVAASGQAAIAQARRSGDALQVLASLTNALPDDTWLNDLLLKDGELTFDGRSGNAAALIGRLSAVPGFNDPSFTAPVTRTADGRADEFSMQTTVQE